MKKRRYGWGVKEKQHRRMGQITTIIILGIAGALGGGRRPLTRKKIEDEG